MKCEFEYDGHCCNCEATQYMIECKQPCENIATMTNADCIRVMSDEELASMLNKAVVCHSLRELGYCHKCPLFGAKPCDTEGLLEWLKQPAEGCP